MYCSAITMRLLVGRLTPAIRATSVTPCGGPPPGGGSRVCVAVHRFQCHLKKATNVKNQRLPAAWPGIAAQSPTGYSGLINGFPALSLTSASDFVYELGQRRRLSPLLRLRKAVLPVFRRKVATGRADFLPIDMPLLTALRRDFRGLALRFFFCPRPVQAAWEA